ncbi:MAG TPA: CHAD domain-containing protein [Longimicrobium sp.]|nr:CHAD domain-containing protein [Longimicrobium sp.]
MRPPAELLDQPVERSARWLALRFLEEAAAGHARLDDADDAEALHDFRVGLRRLRSTVRAYRRWLGGSLGPKDRRRLKALAGATGAARDTEVQIAWVEDRLDRFDAEARPGVEAFLDRLREEKAEADDEMRREVAKDFARERWRLARRLRFYRVEVELDDPAGGPVLAAVLGRLAREAADELERHLSRVRSIDDQDEAHEARITAKRLRYLVEPFAEEIEGGADAVKRIKKLQDVLGEMHDADVLLARVAEELEEARGGRHPDEEEAAGLGALQQELVAARAERYRQLEERWLSGGAAEFCAEVREMSRRVATAGQPNREIERKYLLKRMPRFSGLAVEVREIDQGWLPGERLAERLRRVRVDGKVTYYRTVKLGAGISRFELEEETDERTFRRLWSLTRGKRVRKLRYRVQDGAFTWEIDRFRGRRLVLAEVELPSEDTEVEPPVWLRRLVVRDVTGEPEYVNINLAS